MAFGIDHSGTPPSPALLKSQGVKFVCRYLSYQGNPKNITKGEADALKLANIDIVLVFETTANRALEGRVAGVADAQAANKQAVMVGLPGAPIYFAVDFDALSVQQSKIDDYFQGCASVLGVSRVGGYGGYWVIKRLFDNRRIRYGWQTYAWSGGAWDKRAHIRQYRNGVTFAGIQCDFDESQATDFGQCRPPLKRKVSNAVRRAQLRLWVLGMRKTGASWTGLKKTSKWKLWRRLGGH